MGLGVLGGGFLPCRVASGEAHHEIEATCGGNLWDWLVPCHFDHQLADCEEVLSNAVPPWACIHGLEQSAANEVDLGDEGPQ